MLGKKVQIRPADLRICRVFTFPVWEQLKEKAAEPQQKMLWYAAVQIKSRFIHRQVSGPDIRRLEQLK